MRVIIADIEKLCKAGGVKKVRYFVRGREGKIGVAGDYPTEYLNLRDYGAIMYTKEQLDVIDAELKRIDPTIVFEYTDIMFTSKLKDYFIDNGLKNIVMDIGEDNRTMYLKAHEYGGGNWKDAQIFYLYTSGDKVEIKVKTDVDRSTEVESTVDNIDKLLNILIDYFKDYTEDKDMLKKGKIIGTDNGVLIIKETEGMVIEKGRTKEETKAFMFNREKVKEYARVKNVDMRVAIEYLYASDRSYFEECVIFLTKCDRCGYITDDVTLSNINSDVICGTCKKKETM